MLQFFLYLQYSHFVVFCFVFVFLTKGNFHHLQFRVTKRQFHVTKAFFFFAVLHGTFSSYYTLNCLYVTVPPEGVALWASSLEGGSLSGEPDPLGEPVHDPSILKLDAKRTRCHLWTGELQHVFTAALCWQAHTVQQRQHTGKATKSTSSLHIHGIVLKIQSLLEKLSFSKVL